MNLRIQKIIAWPLRLFFIVGLTIAESGDVLCISDDGHIKIESICQPCCNTTDNVRLLTSSDSRHNHHDDCYNCSDLQLNGPIWYRQNSESISNIILIKSQPLFAFNHNTNSTRPISSRFADTGSFRGHDRSALMISTTVLIC